MTHLKWWRSPAWWRRLALILGIAAAFVVAYSLIVAVAGFENRMALVIQFGRIIVLTMAVVILAPKLWIVFTERPAPPVDYYLVANFLILLSGFLFVNHNTVSRQFGWDASIYTNPTSGSFSLILLLGAALLLLVPRMVKPRQKVIAIFVGITWALGLMVALPLIF